MNNTAVFINDSPIIIDHSIPAIGYISRNTPIGPEKKLVDSFLSAYLSRLHSNVLKTIVFLEPHIDSGYPDIVVVRYKNASRCLWRESHLSLTNIHFKVLFEVGRRKTISISRLSQQTGLELGRLNRIIRELVECRLVVISKRSVQRIALDDYFCVKEIVCFEAKIAKWQEAISQALLNTRFATESYILMDCNESSEEMVNRCKALGVGIYLMNGRIHKDLVAHKQNQPVTYASYLINEIVLRINHLGGIHI